MATAFWAIYLQNLEQCVPSYCFDKMPDLEGERAHVSSQFEDIITIVTGRQQEWGAGVHIVSAVNRKEGFLHWGVVLLFLHSGPPSLRHGVSIYLTPSRNSLTDMRRAAS